MSVIGFPIIDPHIHIWDPRTTPREATPVVKALHRFPKAMERVVRLATPTTLGDFVGNPEYALNPHYPETFHRDTGHHTVDRYVHVEAGWKGRGIVGPAGETAWLASLDDPPAAIVGHADLTDLDHLDQVLDAHAQASPTFTGVRHSLAAHPAPGVHTWTDPRHIGSGSFRVGYERLAERDLSFEAWIYSVQLDDLALLVEAVPETPVVLDHLATPVGIGGPHGGVGGTAQERDRIRKEWMAGLQRLASSSHVMAKLSGLLMCPLGFGFHERPERASADEVVDAIGPLIEFGLDTFGVDRCMFASNFPMDKVSTDYASLYDAFATMTASRSEAERRSLFRDNAARFYRL